jgi:hypothetical protein
MPETMATDYVGKFIYETYILPALMRGDKTVTIKAGEACQRMMLNCATGDINLMCGLLGSMKFRNRYRLVLEAVEGHTLGLAATTFRFGLGLADTVTTKVSARPSSRSVMGGIA